MKERIATLRTALGLSQLDFGEKLGLSRTAVSALELGDRPVSERHIKLILSAFPQVSEAWLRDGVGEMFRESSDHISQLVAQYDFDGLTERLLRAFHSLTPNQQDSVLVLARRFAASLLEDDIDRKVEAYRQELLAEKEAQTSSASPIENAIG